MKNVRNAARAVIIEDGRLLTVEMRHVEQGTFLVLPGGGQIHGETLEDALRRECREELGVEIEIGNVVYVREYLGWSHDFCQRHREFHQLEVVFRCRLARGERVSGHVIGDRNQIGVRWVPLAELRTANFFPAKLRELIQSEDFVIEPLYLGNIN